MSKEKEETKMAEVQNHQHKEKSRSEAATTHQHCINKQNGMSINN